MTRIYITSKQLDEHLEKMRAQVHKDELLQILTPIDEEVKNSFCSDIMDNDWSLTASEKITITIAEARRIRRLIWKLKDRS